MCEWGTVTQVRLMRPKAVSGRTHVLVDSCIASIVQALNDAGIETTGSCCGHGNRPGIISLFDGRELLVAPDFATSRAIDKAFPDIWGNPISEPATRAQLQQRDIR